MNFNLIDYFDFINYCRIENVEIVGKTQKHHIIPKHIFRLKDNAVLKQFNEYLDISYVNDNKNLIELSVENHYIAHILLSIIFEDKNRHVRKANICACYYILLELNMNAALQIAHREKISIRESNISDEEREQLSRRRKGSKRSPESIQKQKETFAITKETAEFKEKMRLSGERQRGQKKNFSAEWYAQHRINSEKNKGYKHTPEAIELIRQAGTGRKMSEECIENRKKFWEENPHKLTEKAFKMANTRKENGSYSHSDESKQQMSDVQLGNDEFSKEQCVIFNIHYDTVKSASEILEIPYMFIRNRLLNINHPDWKLVIESKYRTNNSDRDKRFKKCQIDEIIYETIYDALLHLNIDVKTIRQRLDSTEFLNYNWIKNI